MGEHGVKLFRRVRGEAGFTIVELMAALSVLAIGFLSLAGAMGLGLRQVGLARQRQSAAEIANARLEHLRNLPYDVVALTTQPVHNSDSEDPDFNVDAGGQYYDVPGPAGQEELIVDSVNGQLLHFEDPVSVGATEMKVYQYATWVDDPDVAGSENYRRVSVVVLFKFPSVEGVPKIVTASAFVTPQTVMVNGTTATPQAGASSSPSSSPTSTPGASCSGDTNAPSGDFSISSGSGSETGYTASTQISLDVGVTDPCTPLTAQFSNDSTTYGATSTITSNPESIVWTVPSGDGTKSIWGKFRDGNGNVTVVGPQTVVLDTTVPSTPGTLTYTTSCAGSNRTVNLSWGASTDTNFHGYRIYRSVNNAAWEALGTVSTTTYSDTHAKHLDSVRYYVVGYDKAGNESNASNTVSLNKNQC